MLGIDPEVMSRRSVVCRKVRSIAQRKRRLGEERRVATQVEVDKLLEVGFIQEIQYTTWLVNIVLVKKKNG